MGDLLAPVVDLNGQVVRLNEPIDTHPHAGYAFEYPVTEHHADGTTSIGRMDMYKRACFVLESKQFQEAQAAASQLEHAAAEAGVISALRRPAVPVASPWVGRHWRRAASRAFGRPCPLR